MRIQLARSNWRWRNNEWRILRSAVHSLAPFLHELARSIQPEGEKTTLYDGWLERSREQSKAPDGSPWKEPPVGALGSGSDYTAFLDHIGVASIDMGLNGRGGDLGRSCDSLRAVGSSRRAAAGSSSCMRA